MNKELLEKLKNVKTDEERKQIIEANKAILANEELDQISGGRRPEMGKSYFQCK